MRSKLAALLGRALKVVMVVVVVPLAVGLLAGVLRQLEELRAAGASVREWIVWGFLTYVGLHVILYRPVALFRINHRLFSALAVWLFGGHVTSVEQAGSARNESRPNKGKRSRGESKESEARGSTLVAFSPYVIPLWTVLACAAAWALSHWWDWALIGAPVSFLIGMTTAFHWVMTADDLQPQRERWHVETYLLAVGLVFVLTLLISAAALSVAVPGFSFVEALGDGLSRAQTIYTTLIRRLFL